MDGQGERQDAVENHIPTAEAIEKIRQWDVGWKDFTDAEIEVLYYVVIGDQKAINKCSWMVIKSLIDRKVLVEAARSYSGNEIRLAGHVNAIKRSTNSPDGSMN